MIVFRANLPDPLHELCLTTQDLDSVSSRKMFLFKNILKTFVNAYQSTCLCNVPFRLYTRWFRKSDKPTAFSTQKN